MIEKQNPLVFNSKSATQRELLPDKYTINFQTKKRYDEITERYFINYLKSNIGKLRQINGKAKEKIPNVIAEMFNQKQTGIKIELIDDEID